MRLRLMALAASAGLLTACGLFHADVAPAQAALGELRAAHQRAHARESYLAEQITDPAAKATWNEKIASEWIAIDKLTDGLLAWVDSVGAIDWKQLYEQAKKEIAK